MSRTDEPLAQAAAFRIRARQLEKLPPCQAQCPNSGDIRGWLGIIAQHEKDGISLHEAYDRAWAKIAELNPLPATIGRICPHPCEDRCTRADMDGAVSINAMERFLGDWGVSRALPLPTLASGPFPESIGVIVRPAPPNGCSAKCSCGKPSGLTTGFSPPPSFSS